MSRKILMDTTTLSNNDTVVCIKDKFIRQVHQRWFKHTRIVMLSCCSTCITCVNCSSWILVGFLCKMSE